MLNSLVALSSATTKVYKADVTGFGDGKVTGTVVVFVPHADDMSTKEYTIAYGGFVSGTSPGCVNCGFHIHSGKSCESKELQGGHYFVSPVDADPWNEDTVYTSDDKGDATFHGLVKMGTGDVLGHSVVVHDQGGPRIGCGILEEVPASDTLVSELGKFGGSDCSGMVTAYQIGDTDAICYHGKTSGLEKSLSGFAGVHIHSGVSCESKETQEGHYYDETLAVDPWNVLGYSTTDAEGNAEYAHCVKTGVTGYEGKTFLVHGSDSSRVSCGVLESDTSGSFMRAPFSVLQAIFAMALVGFTLIY